LTTVLKVLGLALACCWAVKLVAVAVSPVLPVLTVALVVVTIAVAVSHRSRL
jgi:hypothetical protein